jgi:hypothetical protein
LPIKSANKKVAQKESSKKQVLQEKKPERHPKNSELVENLIKTITDYEIQLASLGLDDPMRSAYQGIIDSLKSQIQALASQTSKNEKAFTKSQTEMNLRATKASFNSSKHSSVAASKFDIK